MFLAFSNRQISIEAFYGLKEYGKKGYINIQKNKLITPSILNCTEERQAYVVCNGFDLGKACCPIFNSICKINSFSMN